MFTMKAAVVTGCVLLVLILVVAGSSSAEIPKKINYQGRLTDSATGNPLAGSHNMTFRIYDDPDAGSLLWSESQVRSADSAGVFSAILGRFTSIDVSLDGPVWLEVEVGGEVLTPRRELVSVPFAFRAGEAEHTLNADSLGGYAADGFVREGETSIITSEMIIDGTGSNLDADMVDGLNADAFADTGHIHDSRYYTEDELNVSGMVNDAMNPVDWTKLKNVPPDFADGADDVGGAGDGHSLDAADGDPVDAVFVGNAGNVGVGTLSPGEKIDVIGSVNLTDHLKIDGRTVLSSDGLFNVHLGWGVGPQSSGDFNTFLGCRAGSSNTEGEHNTFVGFGAGHSNTTGSVNTFVGYSAGQGNTTGGANTFLGYGTGYTNTTGGFNTGVGYYTGFSNTIGEGNAFIGMGAGYSNEGGHENCFVGRSAGYSNVSGGSNTCIGSFAGFSNTAGGSNVLVGYKAGYHEMGSNKLYIANGSDAEDVLIYGDFSTGKLGLGTLAPAAKLDVDGDINTTSLYKVGGKTILSVSDPRSTMVGFATNVGGVGSMVTCLGDSAGYANAGNYGTFLGALAGRNNAGAANTFVGSQTGYSNAAGAHNTFVGGQAGYKNENGDGNTFVGYQAGWFSKGSDNTFVGLSSGYYNSTGTGNTFVGHSAGWGNSTGERNTCLGNLAGKANIAGSGNVFIGWEAGRFEIGSNKLYIANGDEDSDVLIYGDFSSGRIGMGTTNPQRNLHISGDNPRILIEAEAVNPEVNLKHSGDASSDVWAIYKEGITEDLRFYQGGNKLAIEGGTGNVRIGTDTPQTYKLYVQGTAYATGGWQSSDLRFKKDLEGIGDALGQVLKLRGVLFKWRTEEYPGKGFPEGKHYGVIAQEVEGVLPEVVTEGADGEKAVAYTEIIPVLLEAIKAQQHQIELLEARIAQLEK